MWIQEYAILTILIQVATVLLVTVYSVILCSIIFRIMMLVFLKTIFRINETLLPSSFMQVAFLTSATAPSFAYVSNLASQKKTKKQNNNNNNKKTNKQTNKQKTNLHPHFPAWENR